MTAVVPTKANWAITARYADLYWRGELNTDGQLRSARAVRQKYQSRAKLFVTTPQSNTDTTKPRVWQLRALIRH